MAVARQGTLLLNGGTHAVTGEVVVGGLFGTSNGSAGRDATLQIDAGSLTATTWISVGRGNGTGGVSSNLILNNATASSVNMSAGFNGGNSTNQPKGVITLNGTSSLSVGQTVHIAESAGSNMTLNSNDSATFNQTSTSAGHDAWPGSRTRTRTRAPRARRAGTTSRPTLPELPMTRMGCVDEDMRGFLSSERFSVDVRRSGRPAGHDGRSGA